MSHTTAWTEPAYGDEAFSEYPPNFETDAEGRGFLARLLLVGALAGILAGLCAFQLGWWVALILLALWTVGSLAAGCVAALAAKKHRAGVGYPSDGAAWLKTFSLLYPVSAAVVGLASVAATAGAAVGLAADNASVQYTPAVLVGIVAVLAVALMRWIASSMPHWLLFGSR